MALIVEDGTGKVDAESYASVTDANTYHTARGNDTWSTLSTAETEEALRRATDYIQSTYAGMWNGYQTSTTQALDFPRKYMEMDDYATIVYFSESEIPTAVTNACIELAFKAARGELTPDLTQKVKREKVDVLEVEYADNASQLPRYPMIDKMLSRFLKAGASGTFRKIVRT